MYSLPANKALGEAKTSLEALSDLQQQINDTEHTKSSLYTIFFDHQQAFPRVWRHYICQKLH